MLCAGHAPLALVAFQPALLKEALAQVPLLPTPEPLKRQRTVSSCCGVILTFSEWHSRPAWQPISHSRNPPATSGTARVATRTPAVRDAPPMACQKRGHMPERCRPAL